MKWLIGVPILKDHVYPHDWFIVSTDDYCITEDTVYFKEITPIHYSTSNNDKINPNHKILINYKYWKVNVYDSYEELLTEHFDKLV